MQIINIVASDTKYNLGFTLVDSTNAAVDLTNATLVFEAQSVSNNNITVNGSMTVLVPIAGTCIYTVQATDFVEAGQYNAQIRATYTNGKIITWTDILIIVEPRLPIS